MEGSSDCKKRKGGDEQDGESGGKLLQNATRMTRYWCSICSKRLVPPIFQDLEGGAICSPCRDKLPEGERAATRRYKTIEQYIRNVIVTNGLEVFDCSICSEPLVPPIFQCSKGNSICSPCCDNLPESEHAATQRCYIMERVVNNIFVPCKYGCNSFPKYNRKDIHPRTCMLGPCVCPVSGCGFVAPVTILLDHLTTLHKLAETPIEFFVTSNFPVRTGSQLLRSEHDCLFLLDMVSLESFGHAIYLVCVRPETPQVTVEVILQFSSFGQHSLVSKLEITSDDEPRKCLCALPCGESEAMVSIEIQMTYLLNFEVEEELREEDEEEEDDDYQVNDEDEEEDN